MAETFLEIFDKNLDQPVKKEIIKPGQQKLARTDGVLVYMGGIPYYSTYVGYTDGGGGQPANWRSTRGYVKKADFDALNVSTVSIPANFAGLEAEMIPTRLMDQLFRIVEVVESEDYVEVTARHVWYDNLKNFTLWEVPKENKDTDYSAGAVCRNVLTNAISPVSSNVATDCTDTKKGSEFDYKDKNLVEAFLDPENGICAKFNLNLIRYNWDFYCLKNVGYDRGFVVQNGKNLLGVERTESIENLVTRCAPIAKDKSGNIVWLDNDGKKYVDSQYIGDYSYPHVEIYDTGLKVGEGDVTENNVQEKLLQKGQERFSVDHVDLPEVEMTIEFLSLGDTEEYAQYRGLDKVYLYDIITIHDTVRGYDYTAQVVGVEHDILTGMLTSVTIGKLNNWDGTRKIATWQVPEVNGENIRLLSIQAGAFAPGAIGSDDLQEAIIKYAHFASATIETLDANAITAVTAQIHEIIAGSITADDITAGSITADRIASHSITGEQIYGESITANEIAAGAITTNKLDAYAVTATKLAAGAVEADKIAAGAISAGKIDATDLTAINALLGTANIADARIGVADINFAHIKDLNAQSAYFGQTIFNEAVGGKLYVPRLAVGYAQMLSATISDLVIQASNDNYYKLDVDLNGNVTATQMTPTAEEIAQGYTNDGRTIYMGTDILATDLNTQNIYASHALMDEITANIINVDSLFAREATIGVINAMDLRSNTYIQSVVGDWQSQSTITQTVNGISSRISSLGYGTFYYSLTEPDHNNLVQGDVWIQPIADNTWDDIDELTWNNIDAMTWDDIEGKYKMYCWTGEKFQLMFNNLIVAQLQTEIAQTESAIALKADKTTVNALGQQVETFSGELTVMAGEINAAVSSVNAKTANYTRLTDPASDSSIVLNTGDTWTKPTGGSWNFIESLTWNQLSQLTWDELAGSRQYVWNGSAWVMTSDQGATLTNRTMIDETDRKITLMAQEQLDISDRVYTNTATLTIQANMIAQEVSRATSAESGKLDKTSQYQTADEIVSEAVSQSASSASSLYLAKTTQYQTANAIVTEAVRQAGVAAGSAYIAKTTSYQTADSIVNEAVRQANVAAGNNYIAKTSTYQTADSIKNEAVRVSGTNASALYIAKSGSYTSVDAIIGQAETLAENAATSAKNASIAKTSSYQTAQAIVNSAVASAASSASATYIAKTTSYQTADNIVNEAVRQAGTSASSSYIAKTTTYQTADSIYNAAVTQAASSASSAYIAKTSTYQTANSIVSAANSYTNGQLSSYSTTTQTSTMISNYVTNNAYGKVSGITITANGVDISGSQHVVIASGGYFRVTSGTFGIKSDAGSSEFAIWSGANTAATSPFRVKKDGTVYLTKLVAVAEDGTESEVNLRTAGLWKLNYRTVKTFTASTSAGGVTTLTLGCAGGDLSVNFNSAASVTLDGGKWSGNTFTVKSSNGLSNSTTLTGHTQTGTTSGTFTITEFSPSHQACAWVTATGYGAGNPQIGFNIDASSEYNGGYSAGGSAVTLTAAGWVGGSNVVSASNGKSVTVNLPPISLTGGTSFTNHKTTVYASGGGSSGAVASKEVDATSEYNQGWNDAVDQMNVLGTVYRITAHMNDWVKVEAVGTGYTNPGYIN